MIPVDLAPYDRISPYHLCQLTLAMDAACRRGHSLDLVLAKNGTLQPIDEYRKDRRGRSQTKYEFIGFIVHNEFLDCLAPWRQMGRITLQGVPREDLKKLASLPDYYGIGSVGGRVRPLTPIRDLSGVEEFRNVKLIRKWITGLPPDVQASTIIRYGEFANVFAYQLYALLRFRRPARSAPRTR